MADNKKALRAVYSALQKKNITNLGTEEEFAARMQKPENRRKVYDKMSTLGYSNLGTWEEFDARFAEPKQETPATPAERPAKPAQTEQPSVQQPATGQPTKTETVNETSTQTPSAPPVTMQDLNTQFMYQPEIKEEPVAEKGAGVLKTPAMMEAQKPVSRADEAVRKQTEKEVQRYGVGNEAYTFEEAASAGKEYEALATEMEGFEDRLAAFNEKYSQFEDRIKQLNEGKLKLTPEEAEQFKAQYSEYEKESRSLQNVASRYDALMNTGPGKEYAEISDRMKELGNGPKTPESLLEYAKEYERLQRNPIYRASMGENAPSEDQIRSDYLQTEIAALEQMLESLGGGEKKNLSDINSGLLPGGHAEKNKTKKKDVEKLLAEAKRELEANPYYRKYIAGKVAENQAANEEIGLARTSRFNALKSEWESSNGAVNAFTAQGFQQFADADPEMQRLNAAARMRDDAIRAYETPSKYDETNGFVNVARGLGDWASNPDTYTFGLSEFKDNFGVVVPVLKKVQDLCGNLKEDDVLTDRNLYDLQNRLTEGEMEVLLAYFEKVAAVAAKGSDTSVGYQIGQGIGDMVTLGLEMAATGGLGRAVSKGTERAIKKLVLKKLGQAGYRRAAGEGVSRIALWGVEKVVSDVAETAVRIPFMPSTYKALGEGAIELGSDYRLRDLPEYAPGKVYGQFVEQLTEVSNGFAFPLIGEVTRMPGVQNYIKKVIGDDTMKALGTFIERGDIKLLDDMMIGSFGGEWEEEFLGALIHSVTDDHNALRDFFSAEQQLVLLGTLAPLPLARGAAGGIALTVPAVSAASAWGKAERELKRLGFDDTRIARIKEAVDNGSVPQGARAIMLAMQESGVSGRKAERMGFSRANASPENDVMNVSTTTGGIDAAAYDALAHYFWSAQQKRAAGLMGAVEQDKKVRDKMAELKAQYGQFWHKAMGEDVVEMSTIIGADGKPLNIFITSDEPGTNGEMAYAGEDGSKGFVTRDQLIGINRDGTFAPNPETEMVPINQYLAVRVLEDAQAKEVGQIAGEASVANRSLRQQVEQLPEVSYNGKNGTISSASSSDELAVFVPDDGTDNVEVPWEDLAQQNGIQAPEVTTSGEKVVAGAQAVSEQEARRDQIAEAYRQARESANSQGRGAVIETDGGTATVVNIISDTIDPDAGTAQFTVRLPDGRMSVTMAMPIEDVMAKLEGREQPEPEPEEPPVEEPPVEPEVPRDFRGNEIPMKDGEVDEEAFREKDPEAWAEWNNSLPDGDSRKAMLGTQKRLEGIAKASKDAADKATKELEKLYGKGAPEAEIKKKEGEIREHQARQKKYDDALASIRQRELDKAEAARDAARKAEEERKRKEAEAAAAAEKKGGKGVPDISNDTPEAAQKRGYVMQNGQRIDRAGEDAVKEQGKETRISFAKNEVENGRYGLVEADRLVPSHVRDQENPLHFFARKWQPKNRKKQDSAVALQQMSESLRPEEITRGATAYGGAPIVNKRGEVIQGNGRSEALRRAYEQGTASDYKAWLAEHAGEFGLTREQVEGMKNPVLVRALDVDDARAEALGQKTQTDLESGGEQTFNGKGLAKKLGNRLGEFLDVLFSGDLGEDATATDYINANGQKALKWLHFNKFINDTEFQNATETDRNGDVKFTDATLASFREVCLEPLFANVPEKVRSGYEKLPNIAKLAIQRSMAALSRNAELLSDLQDAIAYYYDFETEDPDFQKAKNAEDAWRAIGNWMQNIRIDGQSEIELHPNELARKLVSFIKGMKKAKALSDLIRAIDAAMRGEAGMFGGAAQNDRIGAYREAGLINEEEENRLRNGEDNDKRGNDAGPDATGAGERPGGGPVREGVPGSGSEAPAETKGGTETPAGGAAPVEGEGVAPKAPASGFGAGNKVFTKEARDRARDILLGKKGKLTSGVDPETLMAMIQYCGYYIEAGTRAFVDFARTAIEDLGDFIRPYLKSMYNAVRDYPGMEEYAKEMTPYAEVAEMDVNTIGQETEVGPEPAPENAEEPEEKAQNPSESPEKSVTSQKEETPVQGSLFAEAEEAPAPAEKEANKPKENGVQGNDGALRPEGLPADSRGPEGQPQQGQGAAGEREGREAGSAERGGQRDGTGNVRLVRPRPDDSVKKNTRNNHVARGEVVYPRTTAARYKANIAAIRLLKEIQEAGRDATPEEMAVLRQFTGWGGLGQFFNDRKSKEYREISGILTQDEIQAAENSINTAYYTPVEVIDAMWDIAKKLGFKGGNVLEGSAGIGNILASMPQAISQRSDIHAVELDPITGGILSLLYPDAKVLIDGFEKADIPNNSVDLAITNVPFGDDIRVYDEKEKDLTRKFGGKIHDFCIAKNIRKLREGGIAIFVTSRSTLDGNSKTLRNWIVNEGGSDIIGAFRLNNETFEGTGATSDIIVVRKRVNGKPSPDAIDVQNTSIVRKETYPGEEKWNNKTYSYEPTEERAAMEVNDYFAEHPENMGGEMAFGFEKGDTFRPGSSALWPAEGVNQQERLNNWVSQFKEQQEVERKEPEIEPEKSTAKKEGQLVLNSKGEVCLSRMGNAVPIGLNANKVGGNSKSQVVKDYDAIKTALDDALDYQLKNSSDDGLKPLLRKLNSAYDTFVARYGYLNKNRNITFLRNDVDFPAIAALENYKEKKGIDGKVKIQVTKAPVFSGRVLGQKVVPTPKSVRDGVIVSVTQFGRVDIPFIAEKLGRDEAEVRKEALESGLCFENPQNSSVEVEYEYLSGNVREKLAYAESHNEDGRYNENIKALKKVIPTDIPAHLIEFSLGSDWLPVSLYTDYAKEKFGLSDKFKPQHFGGSWGVGEDYYNQNNDKNISAGVASAKLGIRKTGVELMMAAMNKTTVKFSITIKEDDGTTRTETDKEASQAAAAKIDEMRDDFKEWCRQKMLKDNELAESIAKTYNETFNAIAPKKIGDQFAPEHFEGQVETMGGKPFHLYPHQAKAVVRATTQPLIMAHEVGTGKTFTLITSAMEMRRLGTAKKPMIVVQNATLGQFVSSAKALYPNAKILTLSENDHSREGRAAFYAKIKYNDWDMVIVPQSVFEMIPDSEQRRRDYMEAKIDETAHILEQARAAKNAAAEKRLKQEIEDLEYERDFGEKPPKSKGKRDAKREAKAKSNAKAKAQQQLDRKTDEVSDFDDMGIDALLVDEAHNYKRLGFSTSMSQGVKGVDPSYSKKSASVYLKVRAVFDKVGWKNVVFATGTPISNTAAEIWTFMRYMMPDEMMRELHLYYFDDFVSNFGNISQSLEFTTSGKFKENSRFASYTNLPELIRIWASVTDTVLTKDAVAAKGKAGEDVEKLDDKVPVMESWTDGDGNVHENQARDIYLPQSKSLVRIMNSIRARLEWYEGLTGKEKRQNSSVPLVMYGLAKMAAIDPRLVDRNAVDEPQSKTNRAVEEVLKALKDSERYKGTCALFCDNFRRMDYSPSGKRVEGFNLFEEVKRKLVESGVPADQIVIMKSGMSTAAKEKIFAAVNAGDVRVIMGTTATLGTGVNIQERLFFEAHLDAPNRPMDYTQRMGRILRQGNLHKEWGIPVRVVRFGVEDSLDVTAYQRLATKSRFINSIMDGRPLIENGMENRILEEEEEGVFDNPVAVLSGSQYAMLKSQAERELRKLRSKKEQHRQDQIYIENALRDNADRVKNLKDRIKYSENRIEMVREKFPDGKVGEIVVEGKKVKNDQDLAETIKEKIYDPLKERVEKKRQAAEVNHYERTYSEFAEYTIQLDGVKLRVIVEIQPKEDWHTHKVSISTNVRYQAAEIGIDDFTARKMPNGINGVKEIIPDFMENVATGKVEQENISAYRERIAKIESDNENMMARRGKPFADEEKLANQEKVVEELTQKMKDEMAAKEAKYAQQASGIDGSTFDLNAAAESLEDEEGGGEEEPKKKSASQDEEGTYFRQLDDPDKIDELEKGKKVKVYRSMQFIPDPNGDVEVDLGDGNGLQKGFLHAPMSAKVNGEWREPIHLAKWEEAEENPDMADEDGYFWLDKGDGSEPMRVAYAPYLHTRRSPLNEQFSSAYKRGNLVIVESEVPESELSSNYTAERSPKSTGEHDWPSGRVSNALAKEGMNTRKVILSRWAKPIRVVPNSEVADIIVGLIGDRDIAFPYNVVTPGLRAELQKRGVRFEGWQGNAPKNVDELIASMQPQYSRRGENLKSPITRANAIATIEGVAKKLGVQFEQDSKLKAKGAFDPKTGRIRINIDAHRNTADLEATLLHEAVAHYGLRKLFGKDWKALRAKLYEQASPEIKARVDAIAKADGLSTEVAMEEYIAQLAEDGRFDQQEESFWQRVLDGIKRLLAKIGIDAGYFTDEDFRAMLYASYRNLQTGGALETAARVATYQALRRNADASHEEGPEDGGPDGGMPGDEDLVNRDSESTEEKRRIKAQAQRDGTFMKAPNGNPTNLTEDQWLTVRTKAFKDWFGDWENDSANASKVIDENGEPLVVYRVGKTDGYAVFDENKGGNWRGFYFTNKDAALQNYATADTSESQLRAFFVKSVNPFTENNFNVLQGDKRELTELGHDGMIYAPQGINARNFEVKVFDSAQIKSATDNNGNFDNGDQNIYHRFIEENGALSQSASDPKDRYENQEDEGELYRKDEGYSLAYTADDIYDRKTSTAGSAVYASQVDEFAPVDSLQEAMAQEKNGPGAKLSENDRVSNRLRELGGRAMNEVRTFHETYLKPMWKAVASLRDAARDADGKKLSMKDLIRYVGLKSGLERNVQFARRDAMRAAKEHYEKEYSDRMAEIAEMKRTEATKLQDRLDRGAISDVTYQNGMTLLEAETKRLQDDAKAERDANLANVDNETAQEYKRLFGEFRQKDYSALLSWFVDEADVKKSDYPSGKAYRRAKAAVRENYVPGVTDLASAEDMARQIVDELESRAGAEASELWKRINAATKETLKFQYEHGVISKQQHNDISSSMAYYIPMRGFEDETAEDLYSYYLNPNAAGFAPTVLAAQGRRTRYKSPFGMIGFMHSSAVTQGLKNEAKLALLGFVRRHKKNTVATVTRAWFRLMKDENGNPVTDATGKKMYEVAYPDVPDDATLDERESIIETFEQEMADLRTKGEAYNAHREVDMRGGVVAFEKEAHKTEHIIRVREGGKEYGIIINGNPAAAQAVNGVRRSGGYETFLRGLRWSRRALSQMFTTFSVPFWISNFQRDQGQGFVTTFVRNKPGYVGKYIINRWKLLAEMLPLVVGRAEKGGIMDKLSPQTAEYYRMYVENGGPMGQNRIEDETDFEKQMNRYLRMQAYDKAYISRGAGALLRFMGSIGESVETITRFATFVTSMEYGRGLHESISDSKEVSTNFARKGHGRRITWEETGRMENKKGRSLNDFERGAVVALTSACEFLRAGIPFFNATIQGAKNKVDNYRRNWAKTLLMDAVYLTAGFGMRFFFGAAGGDDDKEKYGHTSDYTRRYNFLLPLNGLKEDGEWGGVYAKWALPQEYRYMYALGDIIAEGVLKEKPTDDLALDAFEALAQLLPAGAVDPSARGNEFWLNALKSVSPGVAVPVIEAFDNRDFKGSRIYNEGYNGNLEDYPGWTKFLPTTGEGYVKAAAYLNKVTGGGEENQAIRGWIDLNPAIVEHFVQSYLSGPYQLVGGTVSAISKGKDATTRDIPVWNRLFLNTNDNAHDAYYNGMYYYFKERDKEARRLRSEFKGHTTKQAEDFFNSKDYQYMQVFDKWDKADKLYRKAQTLAKESGDKEREEAATADLERVRETIAKECLKIYFGDEDM